MIHLANFPVYTLCELFGAVMWVYGISRKSIIRHNNQRDSSYLPCRFDHRAPLEARGKVPAKNGPTFDTARLGLLRPRVVRMEPAGRIFDISRGLAGWLRGGFGDPNSAPAIGRLPERIKEASGRGAFETGAAPSRGMARMGIREAGLETFPTIKSVQSRGTPSALRHSIATQGSAR